MATPYRRDARGAVPEKRRPSPNYSRTRPSQGTGFFGAMVKLLASSLGLAFVAGTAMGAYQTLRGTAADAPEIAALVSQTVGEALNTPAYLAVNALDLSNGQGDFLVTVSTYGATPYETFAYAGGYAGSTMAQIVLSVVPSWAFRF